MAVTESRRRQFLVFSVAVYGLTFYSVYNATRTSISFLQTIIKLTEGFNVIVLTVFTILNSVLIWKLSTLLLFGDLRLIEYEHIFERLPFTIINTMLMSSMFSEHDFFTVAIFGLLLLYMKVFHWILRDRLEALLQTIQESTKLTDLILTRFTFNLVLLAVADYQILSHCVVNSLANSFGASTSVHLMMGMEFAMLMIDLLNIFLHALLSFYEFYRSQSQGMGNIVDINDDDREEAQFTGLDGKFMYERVIDITTRFLKTVLHGLMLIPFRMPIMLLKDVIWDCLTLYQNATSLWKIWRNNKQLDDKLPTMSQAELKDIDNMCIICMDELLPEHESQNNNHGTNNKPKKLPCGHVLHLYCLKNWMERSQTCPICRLAVFDETGKVVQSSGSTAAEVANQTAGNIEEVATPTSEALALQNQEGQRQDQDPVQRQAQNQIQHQETEQHDSNNPERDPQSIRNSWYSFPIEESNDDSITFSLKDLRTDQLIPAKLVFERKNGIWNDNDNNNDNTNNEEGNVRKIIVRNEIISDTQTIESLKRRISELESKVEDLNKRSRKD